MVSGLFLGFMTYVSFLVTFMKLPWYMQVFFKKHKLLTDITATVLVYFLLTAVSKSIVAIVGSMFAGLLVGTTLEVVAARDKKKAQQLNQQQADNAIHTSSDNSAGADDNLHQLARAAG